MSRENSADKARQGSGKIFNRNFDISMMFCILATVDDESGPGMMFMPFVVMEDLLDKLKLLNYEQEFVSELRMRPLNRFADSSFIKVKFCHLFLACRHYFVLQTNPGEQFFMFTSLSAWLIRKAGVQMEQPQEFDDPNTTISNILDRLRKFGVTIDFAPSKLKQGFGEQVCIVYIVQVYEILQNSTCFLSQCSQGKGILYNSSCFERWSLLHLAPPGR